MLVCFAVREESRFFSDPATPQTQVIVTGIGAHRASTAVNRYLSAHTPKLVVTCGFAGGLNPSLPLGQVVFEDAADGRLTPQLTATGAVPCRFVHSEHIVVTSEEKFRLHRTTGADAVEMESEVIRQACSARSIPAIILRVISDTVLEDLPLDFNRYCAPDGGLRMGRLCLGLAGSPGRIPKLMRFQGRLKRAARNLGQALEQFLSSDDLFRPGGG